MGSDSKKIGKKLKKAIARLKKQRREQKKVRAFFSVCFPNTFLCVRQESAARASALKKEKKAEKKEHEKKEKKKKKEEKRKLRLATIEQTQVVFLSKWTARSNGRRASVGAEGRKGVQTAAVVVEQPPVSSSWLQLEHLSKDLLVLIFCLLPVESLRAVACTNKFFCEFVLASDKGERVWRSLCLRMYNVSTCMLENWKCTFDLASSWTWSNVLVSDSIELSNYNLTARATCSGVGTAKANVIAEAEFDSDFQYWSVRIDRFFFVFLFLERSELLFKASSSKVDF